MLNPKRINKLSPLLVILSLASIGCHPLFCTWNMGYDEVERALNSKDIIGAYKLTPYSKKMMYYEGNYRNIPDSRLNINSDSTYTISNAPDWLDNQMGTSRRNYFSKKGKWFLTCDAKNGCTMELEGMEAGDILSQKKNRFYILLDVGDPDSCQGMVYEKQ